MSDDDEAKAFRVPPQMFREMWPHVSPWLLQGMASADGDMKKLGDDLVTDHAQLWAVIDGTRCRAAFLTSLRFDDAGEIYVDLYSLAGEGVHRWAKQTAEAVCRFAEEEGAKRVIFCGKEGWCRVLPGFRITGEKKPGITIFERAI